MTTPITPITPNHINTKNHFWDSFGHNETEISANWIVRFCQERGEGWQPFSREDIDEFYQRKYPGKRFGFNRLLGGSYKHMTAQSFPYGETRQTDAYILGQDGKYIITFDFVVKCYASSPVKAANEAAQP